ncbi:hypothetical protein PG994_014524 [Apiospora phragmitis]|uniref:NAD(P)-binding protein n=1 Tax=Apiospora phragmitis TaxID=2905665 RepID=A0ABR1T4K8_9PEZI
MEQQARGSHHWCIGQEPARRYLLRPNHTVVGSIRCNKSSPEVADLSATQPAHGSQLHLVHIESTSASDPAQAVEGIKALGIEHLDVVIANAGGGTFPVMPLDKVDVDDMMTTFRINAVGSLLLYQVCKPLLQKAVSPKWISVTSGGGSISMIGAIRSYIGPAYGASKAALNWITSAIHFQNEWIIAIALHPGYWGSFFLGSSCMKRLRVPCFLTVLHRLVQTGPGNATAQMFGMEKAPHTIERCVERMMTVIDEATREETSGKFIRAIEGTEVGW